MSNNKEKRIYKDKVHLFLAIQRTGTAKDKKCIRHIIKEDEEEELRIFEAKIKQLSGEWRIHRTVNARDVNKAYKWFMKHMIDYPERASCIDSIWRTALLQQECKAEKYFMLDVDTKDEDNLFLFEDLLECIENSWVNRPKSTGDKRLVLVKIKTPKGYHYITEPFDTRRICKLDYVTLIRDGFYYIKTVQGRKK